MKPTDNLFITVVGSSLPRLHRLKQRGSLANPAMMHVAKMIPPALLGCGPPRVTAPFVTFASP